MSPGRRPGPTGSSWPTTPWAWASHPHGVTVPLPEEPLGEPHEWRGQAPPMPGAPVEPAAEAGGPTGEVTARAASEELARVLVAAEEAAARIVDGAQARAQGELAEIDRRAARCRPRPTG